MDMRQLFGRGKLYTDSEHITAENVVDILRKAQLIHSQNQNEIQYLWDYYRGKTPILGKTKEVQESKTIKSASTAQMKSSHSSAGTASESRSSISGAARMRA